MKRPAFQFYPADWRNNAKLRRCTFAERGIWIEVMCLLHDSDEYGVLRWPLKDIALAVGCKVPELQSIIRKDVFKGADPEDTCAALMFTPRHAGKAGDPIPLIPEQHGPIWYSSRMVRDEYVRLERGKSNRFGETPKVTPKPPIGGTPNCPPTAREGDGSTSTSTRRSKEAAAPPADFWTEGAQVLAPAGVSFESARAFIGKALKHWPADTVLDALREAKGTADPKAYTVKLLQAKPKKPGAGADPTAGAV